MYDSSEEFIAVWTSCHLVEQVDGEFFCDCRLGIKGKLCAHSMGPVYDRKKDFPIDPRLKPLRFKRKRKVGRPKKLGLALTREQPLLPDDPQEEEEDEPEPIEIDMDVDRWVLSILIFAFWDIINFPLFMKIL